MPLILPYLKRNRFKILLGLLCMIVVDGAQIIVPQIVKSAVDTLADGTLDTGILMAQCLLVVGLGGVTALLRFGWRMLLMGSARDLEKGIRSELFRHLTTLDPPFFDRVKTGDIMAHATSDINHVRMAFGFGLIVLVDTLLMGSVTLGIMIWTHPTLTALAMLPMPFLIYFTRGLGRKMFQFHTTAQESFSLLTEMVRESFFGIRIIKVFNFETAAAQRVVDASRDYFGKNLKRAVVTAALRPLLGFFFNLSTVIIVIYGGMLTVTHQLTPGELVSFLQYMGLLAWPVIAIGWMTNLFQRGMASLARIRRLLAETPDITAPDRPLSAPDIARKIRFSGAGFAYDARHPVLSDITLEIPAGTVLGITGPPGSGKTTLVQLIARLYDLTKGKLTIDGIPIQHLDPDQLREKISWMPQEPFLFSTTIADNILMGRSVPPADLDRVLHACDLTRTLADMPDGLDTRVGERGITLSGGQKQRLALARTLVAPRPIMIFDDPVSQLDTRTAARVIHALFNETRNATVIIISHRLAALTPCHGIIVLENGRIQARGSHEQLIHESRFYRTAYQVQQAEAALTKASSKEDADDG